ncbi:MAG: diguanylate cyclase, partial [Telluria sp.]
MQLRRHFLPSIRSKTAKLVLACLLPTVIGFGALIYDSYQRERTHLLREAERMAQWLKSAVERDLETSETAARALATSPSLQTGDLDAFRVQARALIHPDLPAQAFVLSDITGKPLVHTRFDAGAALPPNPNAASIARAVASGQIETSGLARLGPGHPWMVAVDVPVRIDGKVRYVISAPLTPERLSTLFGALDLPKEWAAGVYDAKHATIARTERQNASLGKLANPALAAAINKSGSGMLELTTRSGLPVFSVYTRMPKRQWVTVIGVPRAAANTTLRNSLASVFLSVAGLIAIGFAIAWRMGGR